MIRSAFCLAIALLVSACSKPASEAPDPHKVGAVPVLHGVIQEVHADKGTLVVKHEDIPGLMPAMTMPFRANAETLKSAKANQAITAEVYRRPDGLWLENVKPVPAKKD